MALTDTQRQKVRMYLGWSERFHQYDSRLEQAMNYRLLLPSDRGEYLVEHLIDGLLRGDSQVLDGDLGIAWLEFCALEFAAFEDGLIAL